MAYLFSLTDAATILELPGADPLFAARRVVSVETLDGTQARDFGAGALSFTLDTELDGDGLCSLLAAVDTGAPLGLAFSLKAYMVRVDSVESRRIGDNAHGVTLSVIVAGVM